VVFSVLVEMMKRQERIESHLKEDGDHLRDRKVQADS